VAKIKLIWVECPKCKGEGGFPVGDDFGSYDFAVDWIDCILCRGEGKTQMGITEEEVKEHERKT